MLTGAFMMLLSTAFLSLRINGSGSFPKPLPAGEERELLDRWAQGDIEARNRLIEHNLRLVAHIIKKYYTQANEQDDLISIGTIGLIKGISSYRPEKGVRLATYASKCIENEILMYFRGLKKSAGDVSLSDSIDVDGDGNSLSLMDIISEDDDMLDRLGMEEMHVRIHSLVEEVLTEREAGIIIMRYGLDGRTPRTQRQVADACGISRSYVSRRRKCKRCPESLENTGLSGHRLFHGAAVETAEGVRISQIP